MKVRACAVEPFARTRTCFSDVCLKIQVRPQAREVTATYSREEMSMQLTAVLASNYPLGSVTVECSQRVGVAKDQWRAWMLQLTVFITHQVCVCGSLRILM